jgi:hypothetical protein
MTRRVHSVWFHSAASALFACLGTAAAEPAPEVTSLPQWVLRAQQRLAFNHTQQRELHSLVDENSARLSALQARYAANRPTIRGARSVKRWRACSAGSAASSP